MIPKGIKLRKNVWNVQLGYFKAFRALLLRKSTNQHLLSVAIVCVWQPWIRSLRFFLPQPYIQVVSAFNVVPHTERERETMKLPFFGGGATTTSSSTFKESESMVGGIEVEDEMGVIRPMVSMDTTYTPGERRQQQHEHERRRRRHGRRIHQWPISENEWHEIGWDDVDDRYG